MPVNILCTSISSFLTHKLPFATTDAEKEELFRLALLEVGERVIPELNRLMQEAGAGTPVFAARRAAVVDVVTVAAGGFVRTCSDPPLGAVFLEELAKQCLDPILRQKVAAFAAQLQARSGAGASSLLLPVRPEVLRRAALGVLAVASVAAWLAVRREEPPLETISPAPVAQTTPAATVQPASSSQETAAPGPVPPVVTAAVPEPPESSPSEKGGETPAVDVFRYTDDAGIIHIVDSREKVPQRYRENVQVVKARPFTPTETPVTVTQGGHVLVPVTISHHGRSGVVTLLVDTGATTTTLTEEAAGRIGLDLSAGKGRLSRLADGRTVSGKHVTVDTLTVGPKSAQKATLAVLEHQGVREEYDGLLGMNFLKLYGHRIDFNRRVIVWDQ